MSGYVSCNRCGTPHDDGTPELCFNCLDEIEKISPDSASMLRVFHYYEKNNVENKKKAEEIEKEILKNE